MAARERRYLRTRHRARTHSHLLSDSGAGELRMTLLHWLLDETVTLAVEHSWRVLFPDDEEADVVDVEADVVDEEADVVDEEADVVDVEAAEDLDVADDADGAAW